MSEILNNVVDEINQTIGSTRVVNDADMKQVAYMNGLINIRVKEANIVENSAKFKLQQEESKSRRKLERDKFNFEKTLRQESQEKELDFKDRELTLKERAMDLEEKKLDIERIRVEHEVEIAKINAKWNFFGALANVGGTVGRSLTYFGLGLIDMNYNYKENQISTKFFNKQQDNIVNNK